MTYPTEAQLVRSAKHTFDVNGMPNGYAIAVFDAVDAARLGDQGPWQRLREHYGDFFPADMVNEAAAIREAYWRRVRGE